jgi:hypothetical protein
MAKKTTNPPALTGRQFWEHHIGEWRRGGLSQARYCRENGLGYQSFLNWKNRLGAESSGPPVRFVELPLPPRDDGPRPLFEFRLEEDLRVSVSFKLSPEIMREMFGGRA